MRAALRERVYVDEDVDGARRAELLELLEEVGPDAEVLERAVERATGYARGPRVALRASKRAIDEGIQGTLAAGVDLELDLFMEVFESEDAANGVASFFEHGPGRATFRGR